MDEILFQVDTPLSYSATLRRQNWERHTAKRPELTDQLANMEACLRNPQVVYRDADGYDHYYSRDYGVGKFSNCYLHILVRTWPDAPDDYIVASAWFTQEIEEGDLKWLTKS